MASKMSGAEGAIQGTTGRWGQDPDDPEWKEQLELSLRGYEVGGTEVNGYSLPRHVTLEL